jgi:hypothetical protein
MFRPLTFISFMRKEKRKTLPPGHSRLNNQHLDFTSGKKKKKTQLSSSNLSSTCREKDIQNLMLVHD